MDIKGAASNVPERRLFDGGGNHGGQSRGQNRALVLSADFPLPDLRADEGQPEAAEREAAQGLFLLL